MSFECARQVFGEEYIEAVRVRVFHYIGSGWALVRRRHTDHLTIHVGPHYTPSDVISLTNPPNVLRIEVSFSWKITRRGQQTAKFLTL